MSFASLVSLLLLGSIAFALVREMRKANPRPAGLQGHIRARGWGLLLLPIALMAAAMTGHVHVLAVAELAIAGALVTWAPRLAAKLVPYALLALALSGLILAKKYTTGFSNHVDYGLVLAGPSSWRTRLVLPQAALYPPVLADRGLGDAIRALALDTPLPTVVDVDLPAQVDLPVASAVYFSVAEALANVTKHAHARSVRIVCPMRPGRCGPRSPTTARAAPIPRPGPGWPESSAGSRGLMASWR